MMSRETISLSKPKQIVLVSCKGNADVFGKKKEIDNIITIGWHMPASFEPPLYIISLGKTRLSLSLIRQSRVFAVNFMGKDYEKEALFCGKNSGVKVDKYKETNLTKEECDTIDCKRIKEASAVYECEVIDEIETGDHILIIGKILKAHSFKDDRRLLYNEGNEFTTTMR